MKILEWGYINDFVIENMQEMKERDDGVLRFLML